MGFRRIPRRWHRSRRSSASRRVAIRARSWADGLGASVPGNLPLPGGPGDGLDRRLEPKDQVFEQATGPRGQQHDRPDAEQPQDLDPGQQHLGGEPLGRPLPQLHGLLHQGVDRARVLGLDSWLPHLVRPAYICQAAKLLPAALADTAAMLCAVAMTEHLAAMAHWPNELFRWLYRAGRSLLRRKAAISGPGSSDTRAPRRSRRGPGWLFLLRSETQRPTGDRTLPDASPSSPVHSASRRVVASLLIWRPQIPGSVVHLARGGPGAVAGRCAPGLRSGLGGRGGRPAPWPFWASSCRAKCAYATCRRAHRASSSPLFKSRARMCCKSGRCSSSVAVTRSPGRVARH